MGKGVYIRLFWGFILCWLVNKAQGNTIALERLDEAIAQRATYMNRKEKRLDHIRKEIEAAKPLQKLALYDKMYDEYYTYRFDSAMTYTLRLRRLAEQLDNPYYQQLSIIHQSLLLATSGYYSQAEDMLLGLELKSLNPSLLFEYNITAYWIYNYWSDYCHDTVFSPVYDSKKLFFLDQAIKKYPNHRDAQYYYLLAESLYWKNKNTIKSSVFYRKAIKMSKEDTRIYASATYALARNYKKLGRMEDYKLWLINAAISDQICPLKENLALQELAMFLFQQSESNAQIASRYIYCSMEDAQFYNNRLRMLEISKRLPAIVSVYEEQLKAKQKAISYGGIALLVLVLILFVAILFIWKQNKKLNKRGDEIERNNRILENLNVQLKKTDATREQYMRLFMDLCAIYIGKMNNYRKLVIRKVKAKQVEDLLRHANSERLTESEASEFYTRFDKVFLELFPTFIDEFNGLLKADEQINLSREGGLTTELRIYALIRLGVKDSTEIATLLFYSPQTIYNYRAATKKKVLNKEHFDEDVVQLCRFN